MGKDISVKAVFNALVDTIEMTIGMPEFEENPKGWNATLEKAILSEIERNPEIVVYQDPARSNENIGIIAANYKLENVVLKVLENEIAATQQNCWGQNIGMVAAINGLEKAARKAQSNPRAAAQKSFNEMTIEGYIKECFDEGEKE